MHQDSIKNNIQEIMLSYREKAYFCDAVVSVFNKDEVFFTLPFGDANENTLFDVVSSRNRHFYLNITFNK